MKRPILIATIGFVLGIIWGLYFNIVLFIFIFGILYISHVLIKYRWKRILKLFINKKVSICFIILFLLGYIYINYMQIDYKRIYDSLDKVKCVGTIISEGQEKDYSYIYKIRIEKINDKKIKKKNFYISIKNKNAVNLKYADKILFEGEYKKPSERRNYKGFDYSYYLKSEAVYGKIYANSNVKILKENNLNIISIYSNKIKRQIINNTNSLFHKKTKGIFLGILIGYDDFLTDDIKDNFSKSSLLHLLAVSGTHISYIILGVTLIFRILKIPKKFNKILLCIFLIFYLYIINFTPSVTRAVIMSIILILQMLVNRKQDIITTISFSIILVLISNPYKILNMGFLLSYAGTIGIIIFINELNSINKCNLKNKLIKNIKDICFVSISAWFLIFPIILYNYNTFSTLFIISNLIAGIIMGPIIIIGLVIIILSFISFYVASNLIKLYNILLIVLIKTTEYISNIPISNIYVKTPNISLIIIYYLIIIITIIFLKINKSNNKFLKRKTNDFYLRFKNIIKKNLIKILFLVLLFFIIILVLKLIPKKLKINFIDVGQGDCTVVTTPMNKNIIIDCGGNENYDIGKNIVFPYLLDKGILKIDYIVISHFDTDHYKGFEYIINNLKIKNVIISKQPEKSENYKSFLKIVKDRNINLLVVNKGDKIKIEKNLYLDVLWPNTNSFIEENALNNNSLVLKLCYNKFNMLFTGDIEEIAEQRLLKEYEKKNNFLESTILKAAHHGSKTSNTQKFLELVNPKIVLIGVGEDNKFGHPSNEVINRLEDLNIKIYRTDIMGEIMLNINNKGKIKVKKFIE